MVTLSVRIDDISIGYIFGNSLHTLMIVLVMPGYICHGRRTIYLSTIFRTISRHRRWL